MSSTSELRLALAVAGSLPVAGTDSTTVRFSVASKPLEGRWEDPFPEGRG